MSDILKVGDNGSGICYSHDSPVVVTGVLVEGFDGFGMNGILVSGDGHTVNLTCGHTGTLIASVSDMTCNGVPVGKQGDSWTDGTGTTTGTITNTSGGITEG
jgi:hypothetical protein